MCVCVELGLVLLISSFVVVLSCAMTFLYDVVDLLFVLVTLPLIELVLCLVDLLFVAVV